MNTLLPLYPLTTNKSSFFSPASMLMSCAEKKEPQLTDKVNIAYLLSGSAARMLSATITAPLDRVKVSIQFSRNNSTEIKSYITPSQTIKRVWAEEGLLGFYRGLPARLIYIAPSASISFLFYERFRYLLHKEVGFMMYTQSLPLSHLCVDVSMAIFSYILHYTHNSYVSHFCLSWSFVFHRNLTTTCSRWLLLCF